MSYCLTVSTIGGAWDTEAIDSSILMAAYKERETTARGRRYIELFGNCTPETLPTSDGSQSADSADVKPKSKEASE